MKITWILIGLVVILFMGFVNAAVFYDQGTDVVNSTGDTLENGTIEIYIYDAASAGNLIYNANFTNNITNGSWNVKIEPDLEYGRIYYKDYVIENDNLNFSGSDRLEFQSPFGLINNASFFNFSLIGTCASGSSIRQVYENGSVICEADDSASVNLTNYALKNESVVFSENITTSSYGFFGWLGSLASRITSLFVVDVNASGNINAANYTLNGTTISSWDEVNVSAVDTNTQKNATGYLYNDSTTIYLNETLLNGTIDLRDNDTTYSHLSNFTDNLGNRGYTNNLNFTNGASYWNSTYATFNKTYADGLYAELQWGYNQTTPAITWSNDTIQVNNASWVSTYNSTYNSKAGYQFAGNNFNGSGNFMTSGNLHINSTVDAVLILEADTDDSNEADNPYILMHQDGGTTNVVIGLTGVADEDPAGNELNDTSTNDLIIHHLEDEGIQFGVDNDLKAEFKSTFNQFFQDTYFTDDVGIGTSSPSGKLSVNVSGNDNVIIWENEDVQAALWVNVNSAGIGTITANDLGFFTNDGSYSMILKNGSGNVGIGTTNPLAKLDVRVISGGAATIGNSDNTATGYASVALGSYLNASGDASVAMGEYSITSGEGAIAMGYNVSALGFASIAMGEECTAFAGPSIAMGSHSSASGLISTAIGYYVNASGTVSTAMGYYTNASGLVSTAIGREIQAGGDYVVAIGLDDMNGVDCAQDNSMCIMGGDVGVGIATPTSKLHVIGAVNATSFIGDGSQLSGITSFISKYNAGSFNGSLYTINSDPALSDSNSIFQILGSDGTPRLQIQNGGSEQASFIVRSFMVVNQNNTRLNQSQNNLCSDWGFEFIDCNTSTTGADMGVQDDFEVQGLVYADDGIYGDTSNWGSYLFLGNITRNHASGENGIFTQLTGDFCDYVASPFLQSQVDAESWVKVMSGDYEGALAEMVFYINSSCVRINNNPAWDIDLSGLNFEIVNYPVFTILDGGFGKFHVGDSPKSKFKIEVHNGTGDHGFEVSSTAGVDQFMSSKFYTDIKTYKGVSAFESVVDASVSTGQTNSNNLILGLVSTNMNAGLHNFMKAAIVGAKSSSLVVNLFELSGDFSSYIKQGSPDEIVKVYYDNSNGTNVDITNAIINNSNNMELFENDNSIVYLGSTVNFTRFSTSLVTTASKNLGLELYYCNTSGDWPQRTGLTDTTDGFTSSGFIGVEQSSPDRGVCNFDMGGTPFANSTNYSYVALKRTANNVVRNPVEGISSISGSSSTFILADDYIKLSGVSAPPVTCSGSYDGAIYYDLDIQVHCSCKAATGWVQMDDYSTGCS